MAQNTNDEFRKFRYYEGVCASSDFVKELAKVLTFGVKSDLDTSIANPDYRVFMAKNWDIVYPLCTLYDGTIDDYKETLENLDFNENVERMNNQIDQITDTVILKTTTTARDIDTEEDDLTVSSDSESKSTTMYLEIYKPKYLANPEEYPLDAERQGLVPQLITKEMYREARKSTASVIYDLTSLVGNTGDNEGVVTVETKSEYVDAVSQSYKKEELFDESTGILTGLATIYGYSVENLDQVIEKPNAGNPTTYLDIDKVYLNSIKNNNYNLYNFIMGILGLKTTFTDSDYDLISQLKMQITLSPGSTSANDVYYITFTYKKEVDIYTIHAGSVKIQKEIGKSANDNLKLELYSEGRYMSIPSQYISSSDTEAIGIAEDINFSLEKVSETTGKNILYGTIVVRFDYNKDLDYVDLSSLEITDSVALSNNHYCLMRMFENINDELTGPATNIVNENGEIVTQNSHVSPWSKLSWYKDFEEVMMDDLDEDVSTTSITDGTLLVPLETPGLNADTKLSYWINTNNDRFSLIVMGNPALDYEEDRHIISACYCGRIDSFENSINDTSGNFALFTSSSTTPCKTSLEVNETQHHIEYAYTNDLFLESNENREENIANYKEYSTKIGGVINCHKITKNGFGIYYITFSNNRYFNENEMPRYMILDADNNPVSLNGATGDKAIYYRTVAYREFVHNGSETKSNQLALYINEKSFDESSDYKVYFCFGYYDQKFVITSGIIRDAFGNVIDIETIDDYGKNTSDGVTSISMFHTRSRAFYQKHHMLFATTEEYMSKVMYGKSAYTGEYYADRIKVTHGNDGPRGILSGLLVIDNSSLYPNDELVINKDFEKDADEMEETFVYFPVTAPFSPLSDSPNSRYGLALKKEEVEPDYKDNTKILKIANSELDFLMQNHNTISGDVTIPSSTSNGCKIYWSVKEDSNWVEDPTGEEIKLQQINLTRTYIGKVIQANNIDVATDKVYNNTTDGWITAQDSSISKGSAKTDGFKSTVTLKNFTPTEDSIGIYYGISEEKITRLQAGTILTDIIDDNTNVENGSNIHEYPLISLITDTYHSINSDTEYGETGTEIEIYNANPEKYLNIFAYKNEEEVSPGVHQKIVTTFTSILMNDEDEDTVLYDLLQYPCSVLAYITNTSNDKQGILVDNILYDTYSFNTLYKDNLSIRFQNMESGKSTTSKAHYITEDAQVATITGNSTTINTIDDDLYVNISFKGDTTD